MKKYEIFSIILIFLAEFLLLMNERIASIAVHSLNILLIIAFIILKKDPRVIQALSLVSLLRIVNMSLPVFSSVTIFWFASLYGIMLLPIALVFRDQELNLKYIGATLEKANLWPFAVLMGTGLAIIEYGVMVTGPLIPDLTSGEIFKLGIVMFFLIGPVEEMIFRSILQQRLEEKIGLTKGLLIASLLFGAMHSGYSNYYEILFATFAGLTIGYGFQKTRSLPFAVIANGVNNIILFGILPFILIPGH
ncbi:MAG: CPBP family intramembrane metalloprotease [Candidatus Methanoperedens sp.]|nr:CPBP family intramembrane metalloprotease [Candidatus Methanoperedens sp.]